MGFFSFSKNKAKTLARSTILSIALATSLGVNAQQIQTFEAQKSKDPHYVVIEQSIIKSYPETAKKVKSIDQETLFNIASSELKDENEIKSQQIKNQLFGHINLLNLFLEASKNKAIIYTKDLPLRKISTEELSAIKTLASKIKSQNATLKQLVNEIVAYGTEPDHAGSLNVEQFKIRFSDGTYEFDIKYTYTILNAKGEQLKIPQELTSQGTYISTFK